MTFSDLKNRIYFLTKTNSTSFPIADIVIAANGAMDRVASLILQADRRWQFDDLNQTDLPIATTSIVSGQQDYSLASAHLDVLKVAVKDSAGNWHVLEAVDQQDLLDGDLNAAGSLPTKYDKLGSSIMLYPAPNYSQAASIKVWFKRGPSYFTSSDTTKTPGFNALYHDLIALWPSYDYAIANGKQNANQIFAEIERKEVQLTADYGHRGPEHARLQASTDSNR